ERVRVIDNLIRGGVGHGITLGTIIQLDGKGDPVPPAGGDGTTTVDPCASRDPGDIFVVVEIIGTGEGGTRTGSLGALRDVVIERNRIYDMGLCGIGVIGFFDLSAVDEFISVNGLTIIGNDISNNLWRTLAPIAPADVNWMGYGGIALADVSGLVIRDNSISDNGSSGLEPVCGIFVLHGEGLEISRNHITDGQRHYRYDEILDAGKTASASPGRRGGINIVYALPPVIPVDVRIVGKAIEQSGVPAAKIHDNVVAVTLGQSLSLSGVGPMSVQGNQFTTRGVVKSGPSSTFLAANVAILNLGLSNEIYLQLAAFTMIANGSLDLSNFSGALAQPASGLDDAGIGRLLANGNVLFSGNQCVLDLIQAGMSLAFSSIGIFSLDDIHFHGNQCDCNLLDDLVLTHALLFGFSLRLNDNRFKEGVLNALFSAVALGFMASVVGNQSTHCLFVRGFVPALTLANSNRVMMDALNSGFCKKYAALASNFGR
ncbi:MAG: right-handed parallel beta-helix repeat-containing protein, partial [Candidatus Omnitrophica bacterium]|nr:right-handed parallel beta-helix repeat-containing protein [Candidatus Omnitrophota bacterium]